ncbi:M23 family metallopeptidase [Microbacterium sp. 3J1]|uniref:M23 family metallopeptidase n=1 Tax=Microbacterium sp. 3J1 TaxID=861269 RepID=UPI000A57E9C7|nr:M23 family metallopeptidase [Microbacterium sp. 3J1]
MTETPFALELPFVGRWLVQNSPASRVPSHGTPQFGTSYAIDFVPVDETGRSAPRTLASVVASEPPTAFAGFGRPILAPAAGEVVVVHDGEVDHAAHRAGASSLWYAITQASRIRAGAAAVAGNHVVIRSSGALVLLAHLRSGSVRVEAGQRVRIGERIGECGNSGNSTEPHLHLQVSDSIERDGRGIPLVFRRTVGAPWVPLTGEVVEA